jgi:protein subunit release factor B
MVFQRLLWIRQKVNIPQARIDRSFSRGSGNGGQNLHASNSRCLLKFNLKTAYWIPLKVRDVFVEQFGSHISSKGTVVIVREDTRSATDNEKLALKQLQSMLDKSEEIAQRPPSDDTDHLTEVERIKSTKSMGQIERHKDRVIGFKKTRSDVKQHRKKTSQFWE